MAEEAIHSAAQEDHGMDSSNFPGTRSASNAPRLPARRQALSQDQAQGQSVEQACRVLVLESDEAAQRSLVGAIEGQVFAGREMQLLVVATPKALMEALDATQEFAAVILNAEYQSSLVGQALVEYIRDIHQMRDCSILLTAAAPFLSCNRSRIESEFLSRYAVSDLRAECRKLDVEGRSALLQASIEASLIKRCA
ncbi:hypothetical protein LNV08_00520 [Paucibacter sp. TC2R-5]|uniref:hypothetical protein n=1 Tax=Paucibacter sp. TC2R-5 TaxID=2893555 RepID=UPI0021E41165|nr:hypothetical protein [Paucibacter sp. TC2R-5]MCV2357451.1 hypothetical protein [Paucibacter sp. TC2R-5]